MFLWKLVTIYQTKVSYINQETVLVLLRTTPDSSIVKMEVTCSSETSVYYRRTTRSYIAEYSSLLEDLPKHLFLQNTIQIEDFFLVSWGGVRLSPLGTSATVWPLELSLRMKYDDKYWAVGGMRIGTGNRSTRRQPAPVPLCSPQIPHDLTWDYTLATSVGSRRLTAWAMAQPINWC
jgi:hypothetical protein